MMLGRAIIIILLILVVAWLIGGMMRGRTRRR
jgi:flagellar biogenesis protein FliO